MIVHYQSTPIHYHVNGKGPAIVLLHGFLESSSMWDRLVPLLSKKNKVITIDLPGHGLSGCIEEIHTMELLAESVHCVLNETNINRAHFIGHSMGGYVTLAFAEKYESMIDHLILLNSTTLGDSIVNKRNRDRAITLIDQKPELFIGLAISGLFAEKNRKQFRSVINSLKNEAIRFPEDGIKALLKGMKERDDRSSILKNFPGKKYMICGIEDPLFQVSSMEELSKSCNTMLFKIDGGHMSVNENWNEIVKIMRFIEFL